MNHASIAAPSPTEYLKQRQMSETPEPEIYDRTKRPILNKIFTYGLSRAYRSIELIEAKSEAKLLRSSWPPTMQTAQPSHQEPLRIFPASSEAENKLALHKKPQPIITKVWPPLKSGPNSAERTNTHFFLLWRSPTVSHTSLMDSPLRGIANGHTGQVPQLPSTGHNTSKIRQPPRVDSWLRRQRPRIASNPPDVC